MMQRNFLGTTIVVTCDAEGCGLCWVYDAFRGATFAGAAKAAAKAGWTILRDPSQRLDLCRPCSSRAAGPSTTTPAASPVPRPSSATPPYAAAQIHLSLGRELN